MKVKLQSIFMASQTMPDESMAHKFQSYVVSGNGLYDFQPLSPHHVSFCDTSVSVNVADVGALSAK
jgi:hypothetical protein